MFVTRYTVMILIGCGHKKFQCIEMRFIDWLNEDTLLNFFIWRIASSLWAPSALFVREYSFIPFMLVCSSPLFKEVMLTYCCGGAANCSSILLFKAFTIVTITACLRLHGTCIKSLPYTIQVCFADANVASACINNSYKQYRKWYVFWGELYNKYVCSIVKQPWTYCTDAVLDFPRQSLKLQK